MRRWFAAVTSIAVLAATTPCVAESLVVVVHAERKVELGIEEIAQIYLRKRRFWEDGAPIVPVNRDAGSSLRARFVRMVLGMDAHQLGVYWNREYFRGVLPPATLASDEAVKRFVAREPRAIGYLEPGAVDDSVRVVLSVGDRDPDEGPADESPVARGAKGP